MLMRSDDDDDDDDDDWQLIMDFRNVFIDEVKVSKPPL